MAPQSSALGPLDEVLGALLETWGHRYHFEMDREERLLLLSKPPDIEVGAKELPDGRIHVVYQPSSDETAEEYCSVGRAVQLIEALMARETLAPVKLPPKPMLDTVTPAVAHSKPGWLARLFRRK